VVVLFQIFLEYSLGNQVVAGAVVFIAGKVEFYLREAREWFVVHYAETFIVPAAVGAYTVRFVPSPRIWEQRIAALIYFIR
jgi:hypothetical protein